MRTIKSLTPLITLFVLFIGVTAVNAAAEKPPQVFYDETGHYMLIEETYADIVSSDPNADAALKSLLKTAQEAERQKSYDWAKTTYQKIVQQYPKSALVNQVQLDIARMEVMSCLKLADASALDSAVDKMLTGFSGNENLPEALHNTAFRCRLANRHDIADKLDGLCNPKLASERICPLGTDGQGRVQYQSRQNGRGPGRVR